MMRLFKRLGRDKRGVSAVEFALIAPALIAFYFGLAELTQAMMAERRVAHTASAIGDLVAQSSQVSSATLTDIFSIGETIMSPFPTTSLKMRITSVVADATLKPMSAWSVGDGMTALANGTKVSLPNNLLTVAGQSVIMSEVEFSYDSPVDYFVPKAVTFSKVFFLRPRKSDTVNKTS